MSFASTSPHPLFSRLTLPTLPVIESSGTSRLTLTALGVGAGLGGVFVLLAMFLIACLRRRRKQNRKHEVAPQQADMVYSPTKPSHLQVVPISLAIGPDGPDDPSPDSDESVIVHQDSFRYEVLAKSTRNFSNVLGQGGFGYVYKGVLRDGTEVAVKKLKLGSRQGEGEFQAEVDTISGVQHKHLVLLVGYCISGDERLLVYEFVPNKTLESHLHGEGRPPLIWSARLRIAIGAAKGLAHLHEECNPKIIHRDVKASNILLDDNFEAKVADFGLAKFSYDNDTHVSTRVMGTIGYLAPEYARSGKLTEKSDVFSFGVVLLELITGFRPLDKYLDDGLVEWARPLLSKALASRKFDVLVDSKLNEYNATEMARMVACAAACVRQDARQRPQMSQVVEALEGNLPIENLYNKTSAPSSKFSESSDYEVQLEILKNFRKLALESSESSSSGFSATASDSVAPPPSFSIPISSTEQNESHPMGSGDSKNDDEDFREIPIL